MSSIETPRATSHPCTNGSPSSLDRRLAHRIHGPREVYNWAKANNIDWRTLLNWKVDATAPETDAGTSEHAKL